MIDASLGMTANPGGGTSSGFSDFANAYDCTRGDPLKKWDRRDFDVAALPRTLDGLELLRCEGKALAARHGGRRFRLEVRGFDPNRDLFLKVSPLEDAE